MDDLIASLTADLEPVERLPSLGRRCLSYLALALAASTVLVLALGLRADLALKVRDAGFVFQATLLAVAFSLLALNAYQLGIPGAERPAVRATALAALTAWVVAAAQSSGPLSSGLACVARMAALAVVPGAALFFLQRKAAPESRRLATALGFLAVGALAMLGTELSCAKDAAAHVLVWHAGPAVLLALLGWAVGEHRLGGGRGRGDAGGHERGKGRNLNSHSFHDCQCGAERGPVTGGR